MNNLTVTDLNTAIDAEPRILDVTLGKRLGMVAPRNLRMKIAANRQELERYGEVCIDSVQTPENKGGRPSTAYYLNEPQAVLLCMFSNTPSAADVRHEIITVFMAHRYGRLSSKIEAPAHHLLTRLETILDIDERARKLDTAVAMIDDMRRRVDEHAASLRQAGAAMRRMLAGPTVQPIQPHGVRRIVDATHRKQVGMEMLAAGTDPRTVAREIGIQEQTARKWARALADNDN